MKKLTAIITILTVINVHAYAQFSLSAGGGINYGSVKITNIDDFKSGNTSNYFLFAKPAVHLTDKFKLSMDVQFSRKGYLNEVFDSLSEVGTYRFQYLDLIPQLEYKFIKQLGVFGGLGIGFNTREKWRVNDVWEETKNKLANKTNFSFVFGLRLYAIESISFHFMYMSSLASASDVVFTDQNGEVSDSKFLLKNLQIGVGFRIL